MWMKVGESKASTLGLWLLRLTPHLIVHLRVSLFGHFNLGGPDDVLLGCRWNDATEVQVLFGQFLLKTEKVGKAATDWKLRRLEIARVGSGKGAKSSGRSFQAKIPMLLLRLLTWCRLCRRRKIPSPLPFSSALKSLMRRVTLLYVLSYFTDSLFRPTLMLINSEAFSSTSASRDS